MGTPNQNLSKTADYVVNGELDLPDLEYVDFIVIVNAAIEILRGLKRWVTIPRIGDQLARWIQGFGDAEHLPANVRSTRGLLFYHSYPAGGPPFYFLSDDLKIYRVGAEWHDGSGRSQDDASSWKYWTPTLERMSIEEFCDDLTSNVHAPLRRTVSTLREELNELRAGMEKRVEYIKEREAALEVLESRISQVG